MMQQLRKNTLRLVMMGIVVVAATLLSTAISYGGVYLNSSYFPNANFRSYVKSNFDKEGIVIPYPHTTVEIIKE